MHNGNQKLPILKVENYIKPFKTYIYIPYPSTYWPSDSRKTPDLLDFCITKGMSGLRLRANSCLELSSDHFPIIVTMGSKVLSRDFPCRLHNAKTNWNYFRQQVMMNLNTNIRLKTEDDVVYAVEHFNRCIQQAAWNATPPSKLRNPNKMLGPHQRENIGEKKNP